MLFKINKGEKHTLIIINIMIFYSVLLKFKLFYNLHFFLINKIFVLFKVKYFIFLLDVLSFNYLATY